MLPDIMHLSFIFIIVVMMMAMLSHLTYGYRVYRMSDVGQAIAYWMQFTLISTDPKCVRAWALVTRGMWGCLCELSLEEQSRRVGEKER